MGGGGGGGGRLLEQEFLFGLTQNVCRHHFESHSAAVSALYHCFNSIPTEAFKKVFLD